MKRVAESTAELHNIAPAQQETTRGAVVVVRKVGNILRKLTSPNQTQVFHPNAGSKNDEGQTKDEDNYLPLRQFN